MPRWSRDETAPEKLRRDRETLHITQRVLASLLGVSHTAIQRWESGQSRITHPAMLHAAMGYWLLLDKPGVFPTDFLIEISDRIGYELAKRKQEVAEPPY